MKTRSKTRLHQRGFLDLASALFIAAVTVGPLLIALAIDIADNLPDADYPPSIYSNE